MVNFLNKWLKLDKRKWNDRLKNRLNNISWKLINYIWDNCFRVLYLYFPLVSAKWEKAFLYSKFLNCVYLFGNIINDNRINIWNSILKEGVNVAWKFFLLFKCCFSIRILLTLFSRYHCKWATFKMFPGSRINTGVPLFWSTIKIIRVIVEKLYETRDDQTILLYKYFFKNRKRITVIIFT